jgi:hypothetical protein
MRSSTSAPSADLAAGFALNLALDFDLDFAIVVLSKSRCS